ncbi:hypothetical protein CCYN2B_500003 [Capnocytophaga cynodegmi]|uniref:Uncharacterized protein n=1 Tax=Capnocytophaga cynodegmi TaxID=28189 RepID=A0A0B7HGQ6_9FLAO|nr:hypothetical protein CCYN2B_500003 [Capnocytophaga cynodegmi]
MISKKFKKNIFEKSSKNFGGLEKIITFAPALRKSLANSN